MKGRGRIDEKVLRGKGRREGLRGVEIEGDVQVNEEEEEGK